MNASMQPRVTIARILKARLEKRSRPTQREFSFAKLNLDANEYFELISWQDAEITEPPLTPDVT